MTEAVPSSGDDPTKETIEKALSANDKVIEIRPAEKSKGFGLKRLLLMGAGAIGVAYWVRNSQRPDDLIGNVKEKTVDRTRQAAETVEEKSETASEDIEEGSEWAGSVVRLRLSPRFPSEQCDRGSSNRLERRCLRACEPRRSARGYLWLGSFSL